MILENEINKLPVTEVYDALASAIDRNTVSILKAPPGSGKSTALPALFLHNDICHGKKILMLEPRRIACCMAAERIAFLLGGKVGEKVGYRMRGETKISSRTRLEIVTEGTFTRLIQNDIELQDYGLIIFDEFHERNIHSDLGLALSLDVRKNLREDLSLLVMSATLNEVELCEFLPQAEYFECAGRMYEVEVKFASERIAFENLVDSAFFLLKKILAETANGNILVFMPGAAEIEKLASMLKNINDDSLVIAPLYGALSHDEQQKALKKTAGFERKIVIATNIAESSVTIDDIKFVVDSGWEKRLVFDNRSAMNRLELQRTAKSSAIQRGGRAGRTSAGKVYRLYTKYEYETMTEHPLPEISSVDLSNFCLELAMWGCRAEDLQFLTPPGAGALQQGITLLQDLKLLNEDGKITPLGAAIVNFPGSCRVGRMFHESEKLGLEVLGCEIASMLEEKVLNSTDLQTALENLRHNPTFSYRKNLNMLLQNRHLKYRQTDLSDMAKLLLAGFPDRVGKRRKNSLNEYQLANGRGAVISDAFEGKTGEYIIAPVLDSGSQQAKIRHAAVFDINLIDENDYHYCQESHFDETGGTFLTEKVKYFRKMVIERRLSGEFDLQSFRKAVQSECSKRSIEAVFGCDDDDRNFRLRCGFAHFSEPEKYPSVSEEDLSADEKFFEFQDVSVRSLGALKKISLKNMLKNYIGYEKLMTLDRDYPEKFLTPGGSNYKIRYTGKEAFLSVPVAEMYGTKVHPVLGRRKLPLKIELLSPAMRVVQITGDLPNFWRENWKYVQKELKQRYIKHFWPDDPASASPGKSIRRDKKMSGS